MKIITITLAALAVFSAGITRAGDFDFRRARWGMTREEVSQTETEAVPFGDMEGLLSYEGTVGGVKAMILYLFQDGRLERGVYSIEPVDPEKVIGDYQGVRFFLIELHGSGAEEDMNLEETELAAKLDPANPDELLELVLARAAEPVTYWETDRSEIYLRLTEKDGRAAIQVDYLSRLP
jgi:hypothetical protein